jgi:ring-1,2-phenylacetyl-CoA epoxidase subunit PaaC
MKPELKDVLAAYLMGLADDELILGHRDSEWCGHAPILEEDITFANIALDEISHALIWYALLADLLGQDPEDYSRQLVYHREVSDFRCTQLVELPKRDWAFSMLRQYFFDVTEKLRLESLMKSQYRPIAEAAARMRDEEAYHLRHTQVWVRRLGLGTPESNHRMQTALNELWTYALIHLQPFAGESLLVDAGYVPVSGDLCEQWQTVVRGFLEEVNLKVPMDREVICQPRDYHSPHLPLLLHGLQEVARLYPGSGW